jgi:hypothetical protein
MPVENPMPGCFLRDFLDRHDARLVTTVMCAFDVAEYSDKLDQRFADTQQPG